MADGLPPAGSAAPFGPAALRDPAVLLSTWGGVGFLPGMPGTWGSLVAALIWWLLLADQHWAWTLALAVLVAVGGWFAVRANQRRYRVGDAGAIVVDEVAGQWLALIAMPATLPALLVGVVAFRLFDIAKPWPVSWADRRHDALGVMLDDLVAGVLALTVGQVAVWLLPLQLGGGSL
ncbi:MAG: phosphatidylglycerophosphatase A [Pseudomonadota bacterium]